MIPGRYLRAIDQQGYEISQTGGVGKGDHNSSVHEKLFFPHFTYRMSEGGLS